MAQVTLMQGDARKAGGAFDMIFTDPPFDMPVSELAQVINRFECDHWFCIANIHLLMAIASGMPEWEAKWDVVFDMVGPKKKANYLQPSYVHYNGVYLVRRGARTRFDRRSGQRSDVFAKHHYPTILRAPRDSQFSQHSQAKNPEALANVLRGFDIDSFVDPFAGSGSAGIAAVDLGLNCTLIEKDPAAYADMAAVLKFLGATQVEMKL
ncbi:hypothetical protein [Halomonas piscis]|uniref:hypothetical protein n=1 Tax=Halomonas piscis TaxID=3031727 RepID=UPI0028984173|nr:hypothetical protein [Halomonas piscis]